MIKSRRIYTMKRKKIAAILCSMTLAMTMTGYTTSAVLAESTSTISETEESDTTENTEGLKEIFFSKKGEKDEERKKNIKNDNIFI